MSGFFRHVTVAAEDAAAHPGLIRQLRREELDGIVVTGVYSEDDCAMLQQRLEQGRHGLVRTSFPGPFRSFFLGINLNLTTPDLEEYFQTAPVFRERLARLFSGTVDLQSRVTGLLAAMDEGRHYVPAPGLADGPDHMFTTLRAAMPGGFIPQHFDNEQAHRPSYRLLSQNIVADLYSFVLAFSQPDEGGALEIFNMRHEGRRFRMVDGEEDASNLDVAGVERVSFRLAPGEMILINS